MTRSPRVITLTEYVSALFPQSEIPNALGEALWQSYDSKVTVDFPTPKTAHQWRLTAQGWVGYIPLSPALGLRLQPKVQLQNLFGMLEYAYQLKSFFFLEGLHECDSIDSLYERLANVLARRVLDRGRKGLYRTYVAKTERLGCVRGRLDIRHTLQRPWDVRLNCTYKEQTADIEDNQILLWTLWQIARCGCCGNQSLPLVRRAFHTLQSVVSLQSCSPEDCLKRLYHRLNEDYQPLHALCRFFLEQAAPGHKQGDRQMLPFLVDMARLYELFVAQWLRAQQTTQLSPQRLTVRSQERVYLDASRSLSFNIDLVLEEVSTSKTRYVLDTKYKTPDSPAPNDIAQIVAYAVAKDCSEAVLIYPEPLQTPLDIRIQNIRVRALTFSIAGDLEQGGNTFLSNLLTPQNLHLGNLSKVQ